jgi:hypothetical protein
MRRHPIHDDAETCLMTAIDQIPQIIRLAKTLCRSIETDGLIPPGYIDRMLGLWQELNMRESHIANIGDEFIRELGILQRPIVLLDPASPRPKMHLISALRAIEGHGSALFRHPITVTPTVGTFVDD